MNRRIIFIVLSAVVLALLVGLVWFFFFRGGAAAPANNGTFGSGTDRPSTGGTGGTSQNNIPSNVLPAGSNTNTGAGISGAGGGSIGAGGNISGGVPGVAGVPGVDWLGDSSAGSGGGPTSSFVPKTVNSLNSNNVSGSPSILPKPGAAPGTDENSFLNTALLGAGIGAALCTAGLLPGVLTGSGIGVGVNAVGAVGPVPVHDFSLNTQTTYGNSLKTNDTLRENFLNCIARTIARAAVEQITASVVNWINSGFNGQPSFVTNYEQFFTNVADQAAGAFIRGSSLSFLCSPFQNQIRTAVAQSYARRSAMSCTLSGVIRNINAFSSGNFSQGGWQGLLAYTGVPTNNPFGAYNYAQNGLANAQNQALSQQQQNYTLGRGFLSSTRPVNCTVTSGPPASGLRPGQQTTPIEGGMYRTCTMVTVTPGSTIADSLSKTLNVSQDTLTQAGISGSFDAIIGALISQLMVKTLQGGLSNLSGTQGYAADYLTPGQQKAQKDAQELLTDMQGRVTLAQQYGSVQQGAIADIQNTQSQLQGLINCWESKGSSAQASSTDTVLHSYDAQIDGYNNNITRANEGITLLQDLQTQAISVTSAGDVAKVSAAYQSALSSGAIITQADVTQAQQDRTTLQSALATRNQQTANELNQCNAS